MERVGEGGTEDIAIHGVGLGIVSDGLCGSRSGDHGHVVVRALSSNGQRGGGGNVAHQSGDALIAHLGEAGDSLRGVALLIHGDDLDLLAVDAAFLVGLLQAQGRTVDNGLTVNGNIAGQGSEDADLDGVAGSGSTGRGSSTGSSSAAGRTAACSQNTGSSHNTGSSQKVTTSDHLFHNEYPPVWKYLQKMQKAEPFPQSGSALGGFIIAPFGEVRNSQTVHTFGGHFRQIM